MVFIREENFSAIEKIDTFQKLKEFLKNRFV